MQETLVDSWVRKFQGRRDRLPMPVFLGFPGDSDGKKNPSAMQETWIRSLGWKDPLEEGMATHSSILAWRIPMDRGSWRAAVHGVTKGRTRLSDFMLSLIQEWIIKGNLWYIKLLSFNTDSWKLFHWNWVQEKYVCYDHSYSTMYYRIQQEKLARNESIRIGNE